jgi:hypothetical protein
MPRPDKAASGKVAGAVTPGTRRVSADLVIGLSLLGVAILGKLLWVITDGGILAVFGAR